MKKLLYILVLSGIFWNGCARKTHSDQSAQVQEPGKRIEILFLGHASEHHNSAKFMPMLSAAIFSKGINLTYTDNPADLNKENLAKYDGLMIYANHDAIKPEQEAALKEFVEGGKGLIPVHSASWSFRNSDWYVQAVGGQFKDHKTGTFVAQIVKPEHPAMQGLSEFETWDETYVHSKINPDITVLMERVEGDHREPWTWVRNQGQGRVFYTAYGHDERTWNNPGFHKLMENGILWAVGEKVQERLARLQLPQAVYVDADVPNYEMRDPAPKFQQPFDVTASQKLIQVPVDFELQLFASEPDIVNPIAMAWDEKGRLWVLETEDYPNEVRDEEGVGRDRIKILEDTNNDGKADKFTVFAENLNIPTSIVFANDGIIISQAPHFLFLKDTNGDDKADVREIIMTGWGKSDTHAGPSNLKYGFDNQIWGVLGYSGFNGTVGGQDMRFGQGVYRFTPDGKKLEFLGRTSNNTWGLGFSEENDVFISTANNTHSAYYSMPGQYLTRVVSGGNNQAVQKIDGHYDMHVATPNLRQVDVHGGFTAAAGHNLYTARSFPKSYWNRVAFVCEPTGRVIHNAILEQNGAGFKEKDGWNLLASSDEWVGPVHAEVGPDGAVWVADWYDFIIQHNPTPRGFENGKGNAYINPLRDNKHGRIYRVVYKGAKPYLPMALSKNDPQALVAALSHDNMFWRATAQRLLVESKNKTVLPGLYNIVNKQEVDEIGLNSPAVHALWTLHGIGALDGSNAEALQVATKALSHPAAGVRKAAAQVLPKSSQTLEGIRKAGLFNDKDLRTRMEALLIAAELPASAEAGKAIYTASLEPESGKDPFVSQALYMAALKHQEGFQQAAREGQALKPSGDKDALLAQRVMNGMLAEQYLLERGNPVLLTYAPDVAGKELVVRATVNKGRGDLRGAVVSQGDKQNGYSVFIQDGKLNMLVRQNGKAYTAAAAQPVPDKFELEARLAKDGAMTLAMDGANVAKAKAPGLFKNTLGHGLRVGSDLASADRVGEYDENFFLNGNIAGGLLELHQPGNSTKAVAKAASAKGTNPANQPAASAAVAKPKPGAANSAPAKGAPATGKSDATIVVKVVEHVMQFDKKTITVKAGQKVTIVLENPDFMQHNLVVIKPGTLDKVGAAADALARDPKGAEKNYVPQMPEVLAATRLVDPEGRVSVQFTVPSTPGDYPYVCTFPGHWRIMNGIMKVVEDPSLSKQ